MKYFKNKWAVIVVLLIGIIALTAFKFQTKKQPQYYTEKAQRGDIQDVVQATGTINAVTTVQVGSQVSGTIQTLNADFNSHVKKDQIVAQIAPSLFKGALLQARADLADAQANLVAAKANLEKAKAAAAQAKLDFDRYTILARDGVVPAQQMDTARAAYQSDQAAAGAAQAQVTQAAAQVQQKSAAVTVAQTNLDHTIIRSPIDGTVVARSVDVGQTVAASLQAPTLFTIAQDLTKMQVYVSTDESDVGAIHAGQEVNFTVDAFPNRRFTGKVSAVRLNATTVQNVVTYTTVVDFANPEMKLFPGMTAYVNIPVATATGVVKLPNAALRYKPDLSADQVTALYQKAGMPANGNARAGRKAGQAQQQPQEQAATAIVWKLADGNTLEPVLIKLGITDHATTEVAQVLKGSLNAGDQIVTGAAGASSRAGAGSAPGVGGARGGMRSMGR
ncbi:MAG TPA: efflux RND transporter periplasmic adaptor subunit [Candidatus Limnocylindrales bacterium]|nr:efflux RND transporter periplasmic adaptor subunit [Candidatus Limnocylindrales bacterium]